jgi:hypothetical protein
MKNNKLPDRDPDADRSREAEHKLNQEFPILGADLLS